MNVLHKNAEKKIKVNVDDHHRRKRGHDVKIKNGIECKSAFRYTIDFRSRECLAFQEKENVKIGL